MWRSEPELDNKPWTTYWEKDDFAGLDMSSVWTTSAYHIKHCTGSYQDTREDQVDQEQTGGAWSAKTYERRGSPGRKQRWQLLTDTDGVGVWPNVSSWIRDESRSRSNTRKHFISSEKLLICGKLLPSAVYWKHNFKRKTRSEKYLKPTTLLKTDSYLLKN